MTQTMKLPS